jgi:Tol biopolymer transport system component
VKDAEVLLKSDETKHATSWSRDGHFLLYTVAHHPKPTTDIWVLPMVGDHKPVPFLATEFSERQAHFSPDGNWVAYASDAAGPAGHPEIYVRSFSMNSSGTAVEAGGQWQISNGGGFEPRWRGEGRELYYRSYPDGRVMAVEIATSPGFRAGKPQPLGPMAMLRGGVYSGGPWDSAADGKRFLALESQGVTEPFTVVLNWQSGLKK